MTSELLSSLRYGSVCDAKAILLFEMGLNPEVYQQNCGRNLGKDLREKFNNHWRMKEVGGNLPSFQQC